MLQTVWRYLFRFKTVFGHGDQAIKQAGHGHFLKISIPHSKHGFIEFLWLLLVKPFVSLSVQFLGIRNGFFGPKGTML